MARDLSGNNLTESLKNAKSYGIFVYMDWPDAPLRLHTGIGTYTFGGNDWLGIGAFGGIDNLEETVELQHREVTLMLSGLNDDIMTDVLADNFWNRDVDIYIGFFDANQALVADPQIMWSGFMDHAELVRGNDNAVKMVCDSRASLLDRINGRRYTDEDLQEEYSGDVFFEFLPQMQDATLVWGGDKVRLTDVNTGLTLEQERGSQPRRTPPRGPPTRVP